MRRSGSTRKSVNSFSDLLNLHGQLNDLFLRHQESLIARRFAEAARRLTAFRRLIRRHIHDEEQRLLPLYDARAGVIPGGPVELFVGEHRKIVAFLDSFRAELRRIRSLRSPSRAILALMDRQAMFKHLMEHHDSREKNILYPHLDRVTTPEERLRILGHCLQRISGPQRSP